ncbi:MAG: nitronate monooxygenase [Firmicutes bacterium]|nr:nitronate monooxygenase [Bacillota bacterium]
MTLPRLRIGDRVARFPFVQGGMAVRISTAGLAAAVAEAGGVGTIAGTGMTPDELRNEVRQARALSTGIIGVNVLFAAKQFAELVRAAIAEKVDFVVSGAGFSRDMYAWGREGGVPILPIVSSAGLAKLGQRLGASAIVVEGAEAGGHLGTDRPIREVLPEVREVTDLPVIAAGGIADGREAADLFALGADGVQLATRFIASDECAAPHEFKMMHVGTDPEDIVLVDSPVGLPGRAIRNPFWERVRAGEDLASSDCRGCLKQCSHRFCILDALNRAQQGDVRNGLVFSGASAPRIKSILSVREIMRLLVEEASERLRELARATAPCGAGCPR